jgi:hypothetical protein
MLREFVNTAIVFQAIAGLSVLDIAGSYEEWGKPLNQRTNAVDGPTFERVSSLRQ